MGIFTRISDIVSSNIVHMLDKAEDPEKMVRLMIQEMEDTLVEVKSSAAKLIAEQKGYERELEQLELEQKTWENKAELAISKGREDLARGALGEKLRLAKSHESLLERLVEATSNLERLKDDIRVLNDKLEDAKQRQKNILMRRQSLKSQEQIQQTLNRAGSVKAFEKFEQYENRLDQLEGGIEANRLRGGKSDSLKEELEDLEAQDSIESELQRLKSKHDIDYHDEGQMKLQ